MFPVLLWLRRWFCTERYYACVQRVQRWRVGVGSAEMRRDVDWKRRQLPTEKQESLRDSFQLHQQVSGPVHASHTRSLCVLCVTLITVWINLKQMIYRKSSGRGLSAIQRKIWLYNSGVDLTYINLLRNPFRPIMSKNRRPRPHWKSLQRSFDTSARFRGKLWKSNIPSRSKTQQCKWACKTLLIHSFSDGLA